MDDLTDYETLPSSSTLCDHVVAGACAGIMEHIVMYPIDSVKTRMQCFRPSPHENYKNAINGVIHLWRTEGLKGSLRGVGAMVGGAGPAHAAYFACYEKVKSLFERLWPHSAHMAPMVGGACATVLHDLVMTPADAVKQRLQIYNSPYHNSLDCLRRVCRTEGVAVLYRAYFTQLTMNVPYQSLHFALYESVQNFVNPSRHYMPWTHMFAGGVAGCLAAAATNPLDVCKTVLNTQDDCMWSSLTQSNYRTADHRVQGLVDAARLVYSLEGFRGFLRGAGARMLSAVPGTAISWSVYEYFKWYLKSTASDARSASSGDTGPPNKLLDFAQTEKPLGLRSRLFPTSNEVACAVSGTSTPRDR